MADLAELERRVQAIEDVEAIQRLKYRYFRHLDLKQWDEMGGCFAPDATVAYGQGKYSFRGVEEIVKFLSQALGKESGSVTIHHGHHPEIELTGPDTATGIWGLYNYMFNVPRNRGIRIGAYYKDEYVKLGGQWKIRHTGYTEIFHEEWSREDTPTIEVTAP